jgi:drug/metabolite transporter (DMT)-like permease
LALVFAIEFTIPVWTAILARIFLGERMTAARVVMLASGILGVLIILRPGSGVIHPAALVMLVGAFLFAFQMIGTKRLSRTDSPMTVVFWMSVVQTPVCLALAIPDWVWPQLKSLHWIIAVGGTSFTAHYCLTRAFKIADASAVVPIDFFRLPLIALVGYMFYGEPLDSFVIAGAVIIFLGTYYALVRERMR